MSRTRTAHGKGRASLTEETTELILPSRIEAIKDAASAAAQFIERAGLEADAAFGIDLAVREAVTNAIIHGNCQDEAKTVEVRLKSSEHLIEITVHDEGEGFDPGEVPDPTDSQNLLKANGRGMLFMRTFMDEVEWSHHPEGGTVVRMVKRV
ncbi:MAG: ATP-binding protein [Acidobacteria bacterium]|nr:MAG: ATP-binding protein [Acidobacteriota bacterium]